MTYSVDYLLITDTIDNYNNGEDPNSSCCFDEHIHGYFADSIPEVLKMISKNYLSDKFMDNDILKNCIVMDDNVIMQGLVGTEGETWLDELDINEWKAGKRDLCARSISFNINIRMTHDDLVNAGIESYD